jgi:hypothetical protein
MTLWPPISADPCHVRRHMRERSPSDGDAATGGRARLVCQCLVIHVRASFCALVAGEPACAHLGFVVDRENETPQFLSRFNLRTF